MAEKWYPETPKTLVDWFNREGRDNGLSIEISSGGIVLCTCKGWRERYTITILAPESDKQVKIISALRMTGLLDLKLSLTDGIAPFTNEDITTNDNNFESWFLARAKNRTLVPDTNSIIDRTFSALAMISDIDLHNIKIEIPRLLILELERQANKPKGKSDEEKNATKRKTMLGYSELIYLKNIGATMLNDAIDKDILFDFSRIAGDLTTDSWIRKEIKDTDCHLKQKGADKKYTLVSSDLINSLSCTAEDIHSIYVSKIESTNIRRASLLQVVKFLIITSTLLEEIVVTVGGKKHTFNGIWTGKTTSEWINDIILCSFDE